MTTASDTVRAYFELLEQADADGVAALFTDDAAVLASGFPTAVGRAAVHTLYTAVCRGYRIECDVVIDRVCEDTGVAVALAHSTEVVSARATGARQTAAYRELFVLRPVGGRWLIREYMFNSPPQAAV